MAGALQSSALPYDSGRAVFCGQFVAAAYTMYESAPNNPTPAPAVLPAGYNFVAWVQMRDFVIEDGNWTFYGLIAQNAATANEFILAIRGTQNLTEWWDDLTSMALTAIPGFGAAGYGFQRIYQTLRVIHYAPAAALAAPAAQPLEAAGTFADQVAALLARQVPRALAPGVMPPSAPAQSITVVGHSLGAALATLYVAENAASPKVSTPLICTFASPRVGDIAFKDKFNALGITSWRIVNELDLVPKLPFLGFWHVEAENAYNSGGSTVWSLECWHSLATYLHLLDPKQPLSPTCAWPQRPAAGALLRAPAAKARAAAALPSAAQKEIALTAPAARGTTINITIKVGPVD